MRRPEGMTFEFQCPGCSAALRVSTKLVGQQGKCQHCGMSVTIPTCSTSAGNSLSLSDATVDDILSEISRRDRSAVLVLFDTPESGTYEVKDLAGAKVRCYSTDDMDDSKMLTAIGNLGRIVQGIGQSRETTSTEDCEKLLEFKGDRLGMSLAEFKKRHQRKTGGIGVSLPWCSSDSSGQKIQGLLSEPWHEKAGVVHARVELPVENNSPTVAGVRTELFLYQFLDARLFRMTAFFDTDSFHVVREAVAAKHGTPTTESDDPMHFVWDNGVSSVQLTRGTIRPKRSSVLNYVYNRLHQEMERRAPKVSEDL